MRTRKLQSLVLSVFCLMLGLLGGELCAQQPITFQYFYDETGQLTRVVDSTGMVIEYVYDAVGNMLQVNRSTLTTPTSVTVEREEVRRTLPLFEIFARLDIRPAKPVSFGPEFGLRNGAMMIGSAVKIRF